ncbi:MAG: hypothetical protein WCX31_06350 [Salinivirgaceae bacterium]|jgi:hypothetical protein
MQLQVTKYLFFFVLYCLPLFTIGQSNDYKVRKCFGYQRDSCATSKNIFYKINEESRSALFLKGQSSRTLFTIYNGRDYRVSLCWDHIIGNQINFKLIDKDTDQVLYDNSKDSYSTEFEFTVAQTRDIYIEISVPGQSTSLEVENNPDIIILQKDTEMGCIGVLIEHMITPTKGF